MTSYNVFDSQIQCEEFNGVNEEEYAEVMGLMAEEAEAAEGYAEWSAEVEEAKDWAGGYTNRRQGPKAGAFDI